MSEASSPVPLLRNSERNDFKRCPWLWQETWLKGYGTRRVPVWSWFGTAVHRALEVRYPPGIKRGKRADVLDAFVESVGTNTGRIWTEQPGALLDEEEVVEATTLGKAMLLGYMEHFGEDTDWEVIHSEQSFQIDVPFPKGSPSEGAIVIMAGTWDSLWRNRRTKKFWLVDHKTRKSFPSIDWSFYEINDQAGTYLWVAPEVLRHLGVFGKKDTIEGLIFNALKKTMPDDRPRNAEGLATNKPQKAHYEAALGSAGIATPSRATIAELHRLAGQHGLTVLGDVSARQQGDLFHREEVYRAPSERVTQAKRVQAEALWMNEIREGRLKAFKNPTEDCVRCPLFDYCQADEASSADGKEIRDTILLRRDFYADHREAMTEGGIDLSTTKEG